MQDNLDTFACLLCSHKHAVLKSAQQQRLSDVAVVSSSLVREPVLDCRQLRARCRYPLLMIAPEGTTKHGNVLLRFSTGAFVPGLPVLPVLLKYRSRHFDPGWGVSNTFWHMYRLLAQFNNHLEVCFVGHKRSSCKLNRLP